MMTYINKTFLKSVCLLGLCLSMFGCGVTPQKTTDAMPYLERAIEKKNWRTAFLHYTHIFQTAPKEDIEKATALVKRNPEVIQAGNSIFQPDELRKQVATSNQLNSGLWIEANALCNLITVESCGEIQSNLKTAEKWVVPNKPVSPPLSLAKPAFEQLAEKEKKQLEEKYNLTLFDGDKIGLITERQVQDVSRAGSSTGSEVGSSLASAVYVNKAISSGSYNMWTDLAVGVLGGVAGAGGNQAPIRQFTIYYTVRTLDNQLKSTEVTQAKPIGEPIGTCFSLTSRQSINSELCSMTTDEIRKKYLTTTPQ